MKRKDCEGCEPLSQGGLCPYFDKNMVCPCSVCLVKSMCLDTCDTFELYRSQINRKDTGFRSTKGY